MKLKIDSELKKDIKLLTSTLIVDVLVDNTVDFPEQFVGLLRKIADNVERQNRRQST